MKIKIVGAGLSGVTAAALLKNSHQISIFDTRAHIGGNCYDSIMYGTLVHNYGPHIFHTDDEGVFKFLSRFTEWKDFQLRPLGNTNIGLISLPYSKKTIAQLGFELSQEEIKIFIFRDYSEKQWGVPFDEIPKSITNRIPKTKDDFDPTWFHNQKYQCIPSDGYTKMFENMLYGVDVSLCVAPNEWKKEKSDLTIYSGKIDEYFDYCYGRLPYRTVEFKHHITTKKQNTFIINQNNKTVDYTRKYDHSYFTENHTGYTVITEEYPKACEEDEIPFYPLPFGDGMLMYSKYKRLAEKEKGVIFVGRLATYTYLDMWMAVKQVITKLKPYV